jgi:hypothetical protein
MQSGTQKKTGSPGAPQTSGSMNLDPVMGNSAEEEDKPGEGKCNGNFRSTVQAQTHFRKAKNQQEDRIHPPFFQGEAHGTGIERPDSFRLSTAFFPILTLLFENRLNMSEFISRKFFLYKAKPFLLS